MSEQTRRQAISVLIVEDDAVTRKALCMAVEETPGLQLAAALDSVSAALAWLAHSGPDVLLIDLGLPDGSGLDVIKACSANRPQTEIMVVTMSGDQASVLASIEAGASGFVLKTAMSTDIAASIFDLHAGGAPMSPGIARMVLARMRERKPPEVLRRPVSSMGLPPTPALLPTRLTKREAVILDLIAKGESYGEVARQLTVSVGTVQTHIKNIYGKLSVHSRGEAVFEAHRRGLLQFEQQGDRRLLRG